MRKSRRAAAIALVIALAQAWAVPALAGRDAWGPLSASPTPTPSATTAPSPTPTPDASPTEAPEPSLALSSSSDRLLAEVGRRLSYGITVSNLGEETLEGLVVVDRVPREISVVGVSLVDGVDGVQIGSHKGREDIVWVLSPLEAGETLELPWLGRAVRKGDLKATNAVTVGAGTELAAASQTDGIAAENVTYLAADAVRGTINPPYRDVERRRVTEPAPASTPGALGAPGATLPLTGLDPAPFASTGAALVLIGCLALGLARSARFRRVGLVALSAILLAACTSGGPERQARPETVPSPEPSIAEEEEPGDDVLGTRIERDEVPVSEGALEEASEDAETPEPQLVTTLEEVEVTAEDLPVVVLGSRAGDDTTTYTWNEQSAAIEQASSSSLLEPGAEAEILSELSLEAGAIRVTVVVRNLLPDSRLAVKGRLVHVIADVAGARLGSLSSEPIDVVLSPGGTTTATFDYLLPTGDYSVQTSFEAE